MKVEVPETLLRVKMEVEVEVMVEVMTMQEGE